MRPAYFMLALAMTACSISALATDVDFECGDSLFQQTAARADPNPFRLSAVQEKRTYEHPIYEGLWPMTLKAFQCDRLGTRMKIDVTLPRVPTAQPRLYEPLRTTLPSMPIAVNLDAPVINVAGASFDHPLYDGLWPATLAAFRRSDVVEDREVFGFSIAMNNLR